MPNFKTVRHEWYSQTAKICHKFRPQNHEGSGGQISFKMSQKPKTSEKKRWQVVGHGSQGNDLTIMIYSKSHSNLHHQKFKRSGSCKGYPYKYTTLPETIYAKIKNI